MTDLAFEPLDPGAFLRRSAAVYGDRLAVIEDERRFTYAELADRADRLAGALIARGVKPGDRVAVLAPNTSMLLEAHFGVPGAHGVLLALNTRLADPEFVHIVGHAGATTLIYDHDFAETARAIADGVDADIALIEVGGDNDAYERLLADAEPTNLPITDEMSLLSLNYTSGTTGTPKGVMYSPRGAYLQALAMAQQMHLGPATVFLWTLPMFHCNGWCFPWAVTAGGGVHVCLRKVEPAEIWRLIREEGVTHFNGAPTVLTAVAYHEEAEQGAPPQHITVATGGAPPSPAIIKRMGNLGIEVVHLYGLTETYGPAAMCDWRPEWDELSLEDQAERKSRQGVANVVGVPIRVLDEDGNDVAADAETLGEVSLRGNNVMLGYYNDEEATAAAAPDGWFRTGDIGVMHPDGYIELRDRAKDVIISGGENISSIEVEQAIAEHPDVLEAAVVASPHEKWGETPTAFVTLKDGAEVTEQDIIDHVKGRLARFKAPTSVTFGELPRTSTGKVQKYVLRDELWQDSDARIG